MTKPTRETSAMSVDVRTRPEISAAGRGRAPFASSLASEAPIVSCPRFSWSMPTSRRSTCRPAVAHTCAMPAPMVPAPTTAISPLTSRAPLDRLDRERDGLAAAEAERYDPAALAARGQRVEERDEEARAGGADRMAERDRAAVHVEAVIGDLQLAPHRFDR